MNKDNSQTLFNLLAQTILHGTNFILIMIFTRYMSTAGYGVVSIFQAYAIFLMAIVGLSVQETIGAAFAHIKQENRNHYLASIYFIAILNFVVMIAVASLFRIPIIRFTGLNLKLLILMFFYSFGIFSFQFVTIKYAYMRKAHISCIYSVTVATLMIVLSWLSIVQKRIQMEEYMGRIIGLTLPYAVFIVIACTIVFRAGNPFRNLRDSFAFGIPMSLPLVLHNLCNVLLGQTDKIMLQKLLKDTSVVGIYSFILAIVMVMNTIYQALNNSWVPVYYLYLKERETNALLEREKKYIDFYTHICLIIVLISPEIVKLIAHRNYWIGIPVIPFCLYSIFMVFHNSLAVNYELYEKKTKTIAISTVSASICNMILNYLLIPRYSMYGAAIATCISYVLLFVFHFVYAKKIGKERFVFPIRSFLINNVSFLVVSVIFYACMELAFVRWGIAILFIVIILKRFIREKVFF